MMSIPSFDVLIFSAFVPLFFVFVSGDRSAGLSRSLHKSNRNFQEPFHVIAHRGASAYAPENTLPAFERALELGTFEVELDIRLSKDSILVIFHDATLDEKTDLDGKVSEYSAEELRSADIGNWFDQTHPENEEKFAGTTLITLRELFETLDRKPYYHIEIKSSEDVIPALLLRLIEEFGLEDRVTIASFSFRHLEHVRRLNSDISICLLLHKKRRLRDVTATRVTLGDQSVLSLQQYWIDEAARLRFNQVGVRMNQLSQEIIAYTQIRGLEIRSFKIKSTQDIDRTILLGCNGMTVDGPDIAIDRLVKIRRQYGE